MPPTATPTPTATTPVPTPTATTPVPTATPAPGSNEFTRVTNLHGGKNNFLRKRLLGNI